MNETEFANMTAMNISTEKAIVLAASIGTNFSAGSDAATETDAGNAVQSKPDEESAYQVPVSREAINIMLICKWAHNIDK